MADPVLSQEVAKRIGFGTVPVGGNATAGMFGRFTGVGLGVEQVNVSIFGENFRTVGSVATGAQYTTVQAAINSISDASSTKPYTIWIYPGTYTENITLTNYIHLFATVPSNMRNIDSMPVPYVTLNCTTGVLLTMPGNAIISINDIAFSITSDTAVTMIKATGTVSGLYLTRCRFLLNSNNPLSYIVDSNSNSFSNNFIDCYIAKTDGSADALNDSALTYAIKLGPYGRCTMDRCSVNFSGKDSTRTYRWINVAWANSTTRSSATFRSCKFVLAKANITAILVYNEFLLGDVLFELCNFNFNSSTAPNEGTFTICKYASVPASITYFRMFNCYFTLYGITGYAYTWATINVVDGSTLNSVEFIGSPAFSRLGMPGITDITDRLDTRLLSLTSGAEVTEISDDTTLADDSATALVTEHAVKTYTDIKLYGDNFKTVNAAGGAMFTTVQAAVDSIDDASSSKIYAIYIFPGTYIEQITTKPYINFYGTKNDQSSTALKWQTDGGTTITIPVITTISNSFTNLSITSSPVDITTDVTSVLTTIKVTGTLNGGGLTFNNCYVTCTSKCSASKTMTVDALIDNFRMSFTNGCNINRTELPSVGLIPADTDTVIGLDFPDVILTASDSTFYFSGISPNRVYSFLNITDSASSSIRNTFNNCTLRLNYGSTTAAGLLHFIYSSVGGTTLMSNCMLSSYRTSAASAALGAHSWFTHVGTGSTAQFKLQNCIGGNFHSVNNVNDLTLFNGFTTNTLELANCYIPFKIVGSPIIAILKTVTTAYQVLLSDKTIISDGTTSYPITLPPIATCPDMTVAIEKINSASYTTTVTAYAGDFIEGAATIDMINQNSILVLKSNGISWIIQNKTRFVTGADITGFSNDATLADASQTESVTEYAVKTYADTKPTISSGTAAPSSTPGKVGDIYIDTSALKLYFATGTSSSADWIAAN